MKKILFLAGLFVAITACYRIEEENSPATETKELTITATRESPDTKTERQSNGDVYWSPSDAISLFFRSGTNGGSKFTAQNTEAVPIAQFKGTIDVISGGGEDTGGEFWFWGIYPYSTENSCDGSSITTVIPTEQVGKAGTFADNTFITMARAKGLELGFYNICSGIKFNVTRDDIKEVRFCGNNEENIAGKIKAVWDNAGKPAIQEYVNGSKAVKVIAPNSGTFETGKDYYLVFAPELLTNGFTMTLITNDDKQGVFLYTNERQFKRGIFVNISNLNERVNVWADAAAAAVKPVTDEGGTVDLEIQSDTECHAVIPDEAKSWISVLPETKTLTNKAIRLKVEPNTGEARKAIVLVVNEGGTVNEPFLIDQPANQEYLQAQLTKEREALIAIYNVMDGANWPDGYNDKWCSESPVGEWAGVGVNSDGLVTSLYLTGLGEVPSNIQQLLKLEQLTINYYSGNSNHEIPSAIFSLENLRFLHLYGGHLIGTIPNSIGSLVNLKHLEINESKISGSIPGAIGNLKNLEYLDLQWNQLSGELPESMGNLIKLRHIILRRNQLGGDIPMSIQKLPIWKYDWGRIISENDFNEQSLSIPAPTIEGVTMEGVNIKYNDKTPGYFVLIQWSAQFDDYLHSQIAALNQMLSKYAGKVDFMGLLSSSREVDLASVESYVAYNSIMWPNIFWTQESEVIVGQELAVDGISRHEYAAPCFPAIFVFHEGKVVYWDLEVYGGVMGLDDFLSINVLGEQPNYYISTDFSHDGEATTLQQATSGNGIDLVLMGDAFSDRQIADGTYDTVMRNAMTAFFSEEPYKSFKERFNVSYVKVVSMTEGYEHPGQALGTGFGTGTYVYGNDDKVIEYAQNVVPDSRMDDALIIVMMNRDYYAGTCFMYYPTVSGDYGRGLSIAYFPTSSDTDTFNGLVSHEAGGHGFAKLADEYAYEEKGAVPSDVVSTARGQEAWGWSKNVDFTGDPTQVKWAQFISDTRYASENIGCYEGAYTYWTGAWRPTENSIMRYNTGGFNAPSRYAIWYRINKLAYGANWNGTYEDFVTYDAVNRTPAASARRQAQIHKRQQHPLPPLAPPVMVGHSWREVVRKAK